MTVFDGKKGLRSVRHVVMAGPSLDSLGGMTQVVKTYRDVGLFEEWNVRFLPTYLRAGLLSQLHRYPTALGCLLLWLIRREVALLHLHSSFRGSFLRKSLLAALVRQFRVPVVFHLHSGGFADYYHHECGPVMRAWVRNTLRSSDKIVCLTQGMAELVRRLEPAARPVVIGNPIALPRDIGAVGARGNVLLYLGRLRATKGISDLIRALPLIAAGGANVECIIAGDGERAPFEAEARSKGVSQMVRFPGWVDGQEKERLLRRATIFVLPSHYEALPVSILEAMAYGIPVVATNVGGIPEVVSDGHNGLLVGANDPAQLADAVSRLLEDEPLRMQLATNGRSTVERSFAASVVVRQIGRLYAELGIAKRVRKDATAVQAIDGGA